MLRESRFKQAFEGQLALDVTPSRHRSVLSHSSSNSKHPELTVVGHSGPKWRGHSGFFSPAESSLIIDWPNAFQGRVAGYNFNAEGRFDSSKVVALNQKMTRASEELWSGNGQEVQQRASKTVSAQSVLLENAMQSFGTARTGKERRSAELKLHRLLAPQTSVVRAETAADGNNDWINKIQRAPGHQVRSSTWEQLFRELGIKPGSEQAKKLQKLVSSLGNRGQGNAIGYLREVAQHHGKDKLVSVAGKLLTFLDEMKGKQAPQGIDPTTLVRDALRDIALPSAIDQGQKGTCGAATIQGKLAAERPEQYVDMLLTLAKGQAYRAPGGKMIQPNDTWKGDSKDNRRLSEKIMQNAIMDLRGRPYNSKVDNAGMRREESEKATQDVFGFSWNQFDQKQSQQPGRHASKQKMWQYIKDDLARGRPVAISFRGHALLAVGFDPGKKEVILSTWGSIYTMGLEEFLNSLESVRHVDDWGRDNRDLPKNRKTQVIDG